jgi:DNA-binding GntR family transcriptional regulator
MKNDRESQKPPDLKNWAYERIKRKVLNLEINAGDQLRIETLAEEMGISRTPIREALLRLESEGMVRAASRVGFFVQSITRRDLQELFELREILESYAAGKAAAEIKDQDIDRLRELQEQAAKAIELGKRLEFMHMEVEIHGLILKKASNERLAKMIDSISDLIQRERILSLKSDANIKESHQEHAQIVDALSKKDAALAGRAMRSHILAVKERILAFLEFHESSNNDQQP